MPSAPYQLPLQRRFLLHRDATHAPCALRGNAHLLDTRGTSCGTTLRDRVVRHIFEAGQSTYPTAQVPCILRHPSSPLARARPTSTGMVVPEDARVDSVIMRFARRTHIEKSTHVGKPMPNSSSVVGEMPNLSLLMA